MYDDPKGMRRYVTEVYADNMELLSPKPVRNSVQEQETQSVSSTDASEAPF